MHYVLAKCLTMETGVLHHLLPDHYRQLHMSLGCLKVKFFAVIHSCPGRKDMLSALCGSAASCYKVDWAGRAPHKYIDMRLIAGWCASECLET